MGWEIVFLFKNLKQIELNVSKICDFFLSSGIEIVFRLCVRACMCVCVWMDEELSKIVRALCMCMRHYNKYGAKHKRLIYTQNRFGLMRTPISSYIFLLNCQESQMFCIFLEWLAYSRVFTGHCACHCQPIPLRRTTDFAQTLFEWWFFFYIYMACDVIFIISHYYKWFIVYWFRAGHLVCAV